MTTQAEQAIEAIHSVSGAYPGHRAVHAKGVVTKGTFQATPEAKALTRAAHMQGDELPVTVRFSNGGSNPAAADRHRDGRGMATKFYLPDGSRTDIVAINLPAFFVRTPEDFIKFTRATKPLPVIGQPGPALFLFLATHREALPALRAALAFKPPVSYSTVRYNGLHAFRWLDAAGGSRFVRYNWLPQAGEHTLGGEEAKGQGRGYLADELGTRLQEGPVRFDLQVQIADRDDAVDDPTKPWPDTRETVTVGTLTLTGLDDTREQGDDILVFDPTRVTDGIELSGDQILAFRSQAYSVSIEQRSGAKRPAAI